MTSRIWCALIIMLLWPALGIAAPENVLTGDGVTELKQYMGHEELSLLAALRDGDLKTHVEIKSPTEFLLKFDQLHTLNSLVLHLDPEATTKGLAEVEVLTSIASASTGFQRLRHATVDLRYKRKSYRFRPTGAKWLMIHITPADNNAPPPITEIELNGKQGAPESAYEFKESPASALAVIEQLQATLNAQISADEQALFADAADGRLDSWSLADAALMASGVTAADSRVRYKQQLEEMVQQSSEAMSGAATMQKANSLLAWMHSAPMKSGYVAEQTDLSTLLDKGSYNCVSSAVLYSILGKRHGLDVRGIEVPDHAFAIVYDGAHNADVETTTPHGFNPSRNRKAVDAFTARTGFAFIPDSKPQLRRETSALGLVALIYYNHGVELSKRKEYQSALLAYFRALSLDKELDSAVKNALATIGSWSASLSERSQYARALEVIDVGLTLAPDDYGLRHNRRAIWQQRINASLQTGDNNASLALMDSAHSADPKAGFLRQKSYLFIQLAQALADEGQWQAALLETAKGKQQLEAQALKDLIRYETNLILRWSSAEIANKQWQSALDALAKGLQLKPKEYRFRQNIAYVLQEWSEAENRLNGADSAAAVVEKILQQFPQLRETKQVGRGFAISRVQELLANNEYSAALDAVRKYGHMLPREREVDTLVRTVYDQQAEAYSRAGQWQHAVDVYAEGRTSFPENKQLQKNEAANWHSWARVHMDKSQWQEALNVYEKAQTQNPKERSYQQNIAYCAQELFASLSLRETANQQLARDLIERFKSVRKLSDTVANQYMREVDALVDQQQFKAAMTLAASASQILDKRTGAKPVRYATDAWGGYHSKRKEWQQAVDAYSEGLSLLPTDSHIKRNTVATWHAWAEPHLNKQGCDKAISIYQRGLKRLPNTGLFKQNIRYCEQQLSR